MRFQKLFKVQYQPMGFSWMCDMPEPGGFDRETTNSTYGEFLGDVRCLVFDVTPKKSSAVRAPGRVRVEDQDCQHRFGLTATYASRSRRTPTFFHMDSGG